MKIPSLKQALSRKPVKDFADQSTVNLTNLILLCFQAIFYMIFSIFRVFFPSRPAKVKEEEK